MLLELIRLGAQEIGKRIQARDVSAEEVTRALLDRISALDPRIHAYLHVNAEGALEQARCVDEKVGRGEAVGRLAGVPVAVKDNMCTRGLPTTCASRILENFVPPYDAYVVSQLREADAVIIGKTNLDEFAMGSSTENSGFGPTRNPWDLERIPGGSSGGSAAAIAADMAFLALGSDTGGSIRQPAALCGVVGLKPTYGRVSRFGLVAFASSLDQIGPITKTVTDAALLSEVIDGYDPRDSTCADVPVPAYVEQIDNLPKGIRIGVLRDFMGEGLDGQVRAAVERAIDVLTGLGMDAVEVSLPHSRIDVKEGRLSSFPVATYYIVATAEASSNLARYDGVHYGHRTEREPADIVDLFSWSRAEGFGDEVKRRIMLGTYALSTGYYDAYYLKAARVRRLIKQDFDRAFEQVDCIVCPVTPTPAFRLGEKTANPLEMYLSDIYTISANLAGIPGLSVPCGFTQDGLPIGLQIMGKHFNELRLFQVARAYEKAAEMSDRHPPLEVSGE